MKELSRRISNDKLNSFWYYGDTIVSYESADRYLVCNAYGEIEVYMPRSLEDNTEELFKCENAVRQAHILNYTDEDIELLLNEDKFRLNNWFGFTYEEGEISTEFEDVANDYDEAIEMMQEYISEFPEEDNF